MVQTYPARHAEFWDALSIQTATFDLPVTQQVSRTAGGAIITADLGASLWRGTVTLAPRPLAVADRQLALIRRMARPGSSFLLSPVGGRRPSDGAGSAAVELQSVSDFSNGIGSWDAGALTTDLPARSPAGIGTALKVTDSLLRDGPRVAAANLNGAVFRLRGWVYNADNAFDLRVGINTETAAGAVANTYAIVATAGLAGWVYFDTTITAPADVAKWRPIVNSNGTAGSAGHTAWLANLRWSRWYLATILSGNKEITIGGLPGAVALSAGDYLSFEYAASPVRYALHQITEDATPGATGLSGTIEVVPPLRSGAATGTQISLVDPALKAVIVPGSVREGREERSKRHGMSFSWVQTLR